MTDEDKRSLKRSLSFAFTLRALGSGESEASAYADTAVRLLDSLHMLDGKLPKITKDMICDAVAPNGG